MTPPYLALALSAGGARGAYEVGAMLHLAEQGMRFRTVAGASIGALNGAFYAQGDGSPGHIAELAKRWRTLPDAGVVQIDGKWALAMLASLAVRELPFLPRLLLGAGIGKGGFLDPKPVERLLDAWINYEAVRSAACEVIVAVLREIDPVIDVATYAWRRATYFRAADCTAETLRKVLLAASAIPFVLPARKIDGEPYTDAGLVDPLPAGELYRQGHRRIVSVFLSDHTIQNRADFPEATLLQVRPSTDINTGLFSCFDFSRDAIERLIDLGYRDARTYCQETRELLEQQIMLKELGKREQMLADTLPARDRIARPAFPETTFTSHKGGQT